MSCYINHCCHFFGFVADPVTNDSVTSEPRPPKEGEGDEVVLEEVIPSVTANEDPPVAMDINNGSGGIVEMQGQKLKETVDLSVARKDIEQESSDAVVTQPTPLEVSEVPGNSTGTSRVPSKRSTKSNTPLNNASKTSLNKSKSSSKNSSRTSSKHSRHGNSDANTTTDNNGGNNSVVTGDVNINNTN